MSRREKRLERLRERYKEFFAYPHLDGMTAIAARGAPVDRKGAIREDPGNCVFARTLRRGDLRVLVLRTKTWIMSVATAELIEYNRTRGLVIPALRPGDPIVLVLSNDAALKEQIHLYDDEKRDFVPGTFTLLPPTLGERLRRDKANDSRRSRGDSRRDSGTRSYQPRVAQLTRIAIARGVSR